MKYLIATFVFFLTIGLSVQTLAENADHACTGETGTNCNDKAAHAGQPEHHDHSAVMNSLFPQKQADRNFSARPEAVELVSPKFLSTVNDGQVQLQWKDSKGATAYHLQIATDPNFKWIVEEEHYVKTNAYSFNKAEAGKKYFWRVAAFKGANDSMYTKSNFTSSAFVTK